MATTTKDTRFDDATARARDLGGTVVDTYESTLKNWADYQEKIGDATRVDLVSTVARAQAQYTRTVANAYADAARELITR